MSRAQPAPPEGAARPSFIAINSRENYSFGRLTAPEEVALYDRIVETTYRQLDVYCDEFQPKRDATRYGLEFEGKLVGICSIDPVEEDDSVYTRLVPEIRARALALDRPLRLLETKNVIVAPEHQNGVALGVMMEWNRAFSHREGFDYVVGTVRWEVLSAFVRVGLVPVANPPLRLLKRDDVLDFLIYFDTHSEMADTYIREKFRRYFHEKRELAIIKERYVKPARRRAPASAAARA
jgi:hypothetical protein